MKIDSLRIKNFRTISAEQVLNLANGLTLVGPNNAGKTNALMAIHMFFTGYDNKHSYNHASDLSYSDRSVKTSLTCHFEMEEGDDDLVEKLAKLRSFLKQEDDSMEFSINVYFSGDNPVYQVYPGVKRPEGKSPQYSMAQKAFVQAVLDSFKTYYIPSKKSIDELYDQFVLPFIRLKVGSALEEHLPLIRNSVAAIAGSMNTVLRENGLDNIDVDFDIPNGTVKDLITGFDLRVSDPDPSSIYSKGMGVQAAVLLSSFKWITEQQTDVKVIWLVEEPETYMHPSLASQASKILDGLADISTVVKTTHAINFVPSDIQRVQGVSRIGKMNNTMVRQFVTHREATEAIRKSLGVKFSDYFSLSKYNLFVEGETDKQYLEHVWGQMLPNQKALYPYLESSQLLIKDFTGVVDLVGFLKSNFALIRAEVLTVTLFDGDRAGVDAARAMASFCSNKGFSFNGNREYVLIPGGHPIEGLFPDSWIMEAFTHEPAWFEGGSPVVDAADKLLSFKIRDGSKKAFMSFVLDKYDEDTTYDSSEKFFLLFEAINRAFGKQDVG